MSDEVVDWAVGIEEPDERRDREGNGNWACECCLEVPVCAEEGRAQERMALDVS